MTRRERGQVLVVVTLSALGIIAIIGLALDVGLLFIGNARLRRAVDAAALGAALQVREDYTQADLDNAATEFLLLNGVTLSGPVHVDTCDTVPSLCYDSVNKVQVPRKLVRVRASATIHLAFLPVIGIDNISIGADSISETASLDVVLLIDRSESMTFDAPDGDRMLDPHECNNAPSSGDGFVGNCKPFDSVKRAAVSFVERLFFPYDRVAVVTFDRTADVRLHLKDDCPSAPCTAADIQNTIETTIKNLTVYEGEGVYPNGIPSRCYWGDRSQRMDFDFLCLQTPALYTDPDTGNTVWNFMGLQSPNVVGKPHDEQDPSGSGSTNTGLGLNLAGNEFAEKPIRQQALWVVVLLTDGLANNGYHVQADGTIDEYYCPPATYFNGIICNDLLPWTRHPGTSTSYDADDYAYDMADFVGQQETATTHGQGALMFTIGLGNAVHGYGVQKTPSSPVLYPGEEFLKYAASIGRGEYFFAPTDTELTEVFRKIADNIAIRLTH